MTDTLYSTIPHSREAEEATLGSVLINPEIFSDISFLAVEDFYIHRHRWVWQAFLVLVEKRTPIDLLTLTEELDRKGQLNKMGGPAFLTGLCNQSPSSLNAESYARIVEDHSKRRQIILMANEAASRAYNENIPIEVVVSGAKSDFQEIDAPSGDEFQTLGELAEAEYNRVSDGKTVPFLPTGWVDLDKLVQMADGDLWILAGRPGQGKTGLVLGVAKHNASKLKKNVAIFSLEMSNAQIHRRLLSQETGIDSTRLRNANLKEDEWPILIRATQDMAHWNIFMHDTPAINPSQIWSACRKLQKSKGLDLVIVDYLQLMGSDKKIENRTQEVSYISRNLKMLARELNVPVLAAAQLSRAVEMRSDKRPILSDLRESGSIEQDADGVMFIYRPDQYEKDTRQNIAEIIVAKHRNGPVGTIDLVFRSSLAKFENAATTMFYTNETAAIRAQSAAVGSED